MVVHRRAVGVGGTLLPAIIMKHLLLTLLLLSTTLEASKPTSNLTIVDTAVFYDDFWQTPEGLAFWDTIEGKSVLQIMFYYQQRMQNK